jgi:hypothetical protein
MPHAAQSRVKGLRVPPAGSETTIVYALDRAYADLVRMCAGTTPTGLLPPSGGPVALAARWLTTQDAINERAVTIDRGGCAPARSEHNVIATTAK